MIAATIASVGSAQGFERDRETLDDVGAVARDGRWLIDRTGR